MTDRPNIVMIVTDDHAAHAVGAYGSIVNRTPRIDEIAANGALFDHCLCTNSLCAPSRASILTGTYSHVNGVTTLATHIDAGQETFVSVLGAAGYATAIIGKWHLGHGPGHDPQNFDHWEVLIDQGEYFDPRFLSTDGLTVREGYATDVITDRALAWIDTVPAEQPYCVLIHHKAPHRPWEPDPAHAGMYADPIPVPDTFNDDYATRAAAARHATMRIAEHLSLADLKQLPPPELAGDELALWKYQRYMQDYLECVASIDDNVGRVLDALRDRGEAGDTVVIYTSDQGFFLGDHGWFDKRFMYEESIRMPFVMSWPARIPPGTTVEPLVANVDIAPTLLDAAGLPPTPRLQGHSFLPLASGAAEGPIHPQGVYYRYFENDDSHHHVLAHYGLRTERYKLIYFYADEVGLPGAGPLAYVPEWELYDLLDDPHELRNRYHDPAYADVARRLTTQLHERQASLGDRPHPTDRADAPG